MARVLKPGGVLSFLTITVTPDLSGDRRQRAIELGDPDDLAEPGYEVLLGGVGFLDVSIEDVTVEYAGTLAALTGAWLDDADAIRAVIGSDEFTSKIERRQRSLRGVAEGLHQRIWVTGRAPDS